jgi:ATP-binding cassette subfamily B protein
MLAAIGAHMFALAMPQFLQNLVNSLVAGGIDALIPAVGLILAIGVAEAVFVLLRRWLVLTPGTYV